MESSGFYEGKYSSWLTLRTEWTSTQNQSTNKSTVVCNHYLINTQSLSIKSRNNNICTVGDTSQIFSSPAISSKGTHFLGTTTHTIQHEDDGTKSVDFSTTFQLLATLTGEYVEKLTAESGTIELPPIPRNSTLTYVSGNPDNDYPTIMVDDITTQINIKYKKDIDSYFNVLKISAVNDGNTKEIKTITESDILSQNCIFSFTQDELNEIWDFTKDINAGIIIDNTLINLCYLNFELLTYSDSNMEEQIGNVSKIVRTARLTVATSKPNLSATLKDVNDKTIALTEDDNVLVRYGSTARVTPTYSANKGAYIKNVTVNGLDLGNYSYLDIVNSSATTYTIVVTDSRGLSTTLVFQSSDSNGDNYFELINYIPLTGRIDKLERNQPADSKMKLEYSGNYFNGSFNTNNINTLEVSFRYKKTTEEDYSEWISLSPVIENNTYSQIFVSEAVLNYESAYDIEVQAIDKLSTYPITNSKLNKGIPIANWNSEKFNVNGILMINNEEIKEFKSDILNTHSDSQTDVYSCDYVNKLNTYSAEETIIGTWIDGKPLYRKVISINTGYLNELEISHGIENYDKIWIDFGDSYYLANNGVTVPLNANSYYGDFTQMNDAMVYQNKIILYSTGGWNEAWEKVITIKCTKTTD